MLSSEVVRTLVQSSSADLRHINSFEILGSKVLNEAAGIVPLVKEGGCEAFQGSLGLSKDSWVIGHLMTTSGRYRTHMRYCSTDKYLQATSTSRDPAAAREINLGSPEVTHLRLARDRYVV
jgi:hypothetical protein